MARALDRTHEAEFGERRGREFGLERVTPCTLGCTRYARLDSFFAAGEHLAELRRDQVAIIAKLALHARGSVAIFAEAEPRGEDRERTRVDGQRMRLEAGGDLQLVLDVAQKEVRVFEFSRARR